MFLIIVVLNDVRIGEYSTETICREEEEMTRSKLCRFMNGDV